LSAAAMLDGLEWNVRLSVVDNGAILEKFRAIFEQYWADSDFRPYDPSRDAEFYDDQIRRQIHQRTRLLTAFDIHPRPHQQEILDALEFERSHGHRRNLVVAATGTGKTIVAALDYKRIKNQFGKASLLFVAHRREILDQSQTTFQVVLKNGAFGERLQAGEVPRAGEHVFASVQSLHEDRLKELSPDAYDVLIIDEFHHAAAPTYERLLTHLKPKFLIGLTATPERTDGKNILGWFDGRIAAELRLWKALDQGLLCPFQYFGITGPNVSGVKWSRGRYDLRELSNVYTGDDFFVKRVLQEFHAKVADVSKMRALGFCVDIAHAEFMAARFNEAGIDARAIVGTTPGPNRDAALSALDTGELRIIFSVDLFNEGVDLPDVDTILFLRPTESATLFLQQLGRGLRKSDSKECLTVLDFIGAANRKFRFDVRFRAIVGGTRRALIDEIERGFPTLPSGCSIQLDRVATQAVIENIKQALGVGARGLIEDLRSVGDVSLADFLAAAQIDIEDLYARTGRCFTALRREAGFEQGPANEQIERAFARMLHVDDSNRLDGFRTFLAQEMTPRADPADPIQRLLFILLGYVRRPFSEMDAAWRMLWESPWLRSELRQLLDLLDDRRRNVDFDVGPAEIPLRVHARYTLDEVMASVDEQNEKGSIMRIQAGVYYLEHFRTDLFFVTLEKSERDYSPTTLYRDYPMSDHRFHWETQSNCHEETRTGRRYLSIRPRSDQHALLFVRQKRQNERGVTAPYLLLGPVYYETHRGSRPMQIEWSLEHPIPPSFYQEIKLAAG
jgi:superfamily II DNA or RNA helicase